MAEQQESASNFKRMSLDKIMEAATSDLDGSNNRYVAFGINPQHTAPNSWGHQYCGSETQHYYIPEEAPHGYSSNGDSSYFPPQEINHIGIDKNNDFIRTIDVGKGNFINVVYGNASQIMAEQCHISNIAQYTSPNVIERDYDLFDDRRQVNMPPNIPRRNLNGTRLIENLVGNWMPNQSGTYSPFGGNCDVIPAQRINASVKDLEELPRSSVNAAQQKKPRAVAEVKPMRPSYSDVLTKSATMSTASPFTVQSIKPKVECLGKKVTNKNSKNKAKATMLRRQNSCGNDDHNSPKIEILSQQKVLEKSNANLARRWVSLDNLGSTESRDISGFDKASQPDGKKTSKLAKGVEKEETFSNEKLSNTNGKSSASIPKRSVQTSNNMNMTNTSSQTIPTERVVEKSNQQQRQQGVNKVNKEEKKITKEKNSKRFLYEKTQQIKKAQRNRKRENSGGDSPVKDLCKNLKKYVSHWMKIALKILFWLLHLVFDVVGMSANLLILLGKCGWYHAILYLKYIWVYVIVTCSKVRFLNAICKKLDTWLLNSRFEFWRKMKRKSKEKEENSSWVREGLETNIALPSTGEEAMKRLLACKGKDPYSILGVTPTCSDDDIKKYYKRQAFLVHPDKNNQPGAEEAFKILVHAFHIIGEPERRQVFDQTRLAEATWVVLRDLLSQLHRKMEEAANTIRCIKCGLRHKRIPTQRPCYAARFCAQCKIRHSAKEGDFWAESHLMGFLWHYYACMEGAVYDVTDWAACQAGNIKQLKANTHSVQYRIVLGQRQSSQSANSGKKRQQIGGNSSETDFEDFISNLQSNSKNGSISTPNQNSFGGGGGGGDCKRRKTKRKK